MDRAAPGARANDKDMRMTSLLRSFSPKVRVLLTALATTVITACGQDPAAHMTPPPPEVAAVTVKRGALPLDLEYTGRTAGSREVEVRARVSGILLERRYEEGSAVHKGDVLFRLDPDPFRAAASQARAEATVARAQLDQARRERDRILPLFEKQAVSQRQRDEAVSGFEVAAANLEAAEARARSAQLDLSYTEVRAPIGGLASREARSEGSLVTAGSESSLLTRIVQTDPLYAEFTVPEDEAALLRARLASGQDLDAAIALDSASPQTLRGKLTFVDNAVETTSGTVRARVVVPNGESRLVPGQFIRVRVEGLALNDVVTVPRRAIMNSAQGTFAWVVGQGDVVQMRPIRVARTMADVAVIAEGLADGERVISEGVLKVQPGATVSVVNPTAESQVAESDAALAKGTSR
jgi:membrane fusion protein (multidrug efflux system)